MIAILALMNAHAGVTNTTTGNTYDDIATAVLEATGAQTIAVDPGTYPEFKMVVDKNITVSGTGPGVILINDLSNGSGEIFEVVGNAKLTLENLTLTGDYRAVKVFGSAIELTDVVFDWNFAFDFGVSIHATDSTITLTNVQFNQPTSVAGGAAIFANRSVLTMTGVVFDGAFSGDYGGAIYLIDTPATLTHCTFTNNITDEDGGAIHATGTATLDITGSTFSGNRAFWSGGAIDSDVPLTVTDSSFQANAARFSGAIEATESVDVLRTEFCGNVADFTGAVHVTKPSTFTNAVFAGNHSSLSINPDALFVASAELVTVRHSTFVGHEGLAFMGLGAEIRNSIFAHNGTAVGAGDIDWTAFWDNEVDGVFGIVTLGANILEADPDFQDWTDDDTCNDRFWPSWNSPMIDAGTGPDLNSTVADLGATGGVDADPALWVDADSDNWVMMWDCDNDDPTAYPGAVEIPGNDIDEDCDGEAPAIDDTDTPTDTEPVAPTKNGPVSEENGCGCESTAHQASWISLAMGINIRRRRLGATLGDRSLLGCDTVAP
jgi:predicted outer membrane repeat protein